jgi:hypothetical protein
MHAKEVSVEKKRFREGANQTNHKNTLPRQKEA